MTLAACVLGQAACLCGLEFCAMLVSFTNTMYANFLSMVLTVLFMLLMYLKLCELHHKATYFVDISADIEEGFTARASLHGLRFAALPRISVLWLGSSWTISPKVSNVAHTLIRPQICSCSVRLFE